MGITGEYILIERRKLSGWQATISTKEITKTIYNSDLDNIWIDVKVLLEGGKDEETI